MSKELVCPFCQQELRKIHPTYVICDNCRITGEDKLWQELIRTRKALDVAVDALNAGKTLADIAGFKMLVAGLEEALNKITALEQKE